MRVILVEDDPVLGDGIKAALTQAGYTVDWFLDGEGGDQALTVSTFDLLVLDLKLPGISGLDVLQALRRRGQDLPVLILSARDTVQDRVQALDMGADDYLIKPFDIDELYARARALLRRSHQRSVPVIEHQNIVLDPAARTVSLSGVAVNLSMKEFQLLEHLLENKGRVLSREQLEDMLYGWNESVGSNAVEVHIHNLRKKFGSDLIKTVRGLGYVIR